MENLKMYNTEFCMINYNEMDKVILLTWKKFCSGDDYRNPVKYALELLEKNENSNFIVDARNGFEDEKEDAQWAFSEFIPKMAKTNCKDIVFIMNEVNDIESEMDMWTKEFMKYFHVSRVSSYKEAIDLLNRKHKILSLNVVYTVKDGTRAEFYNKLTEKKIIENSQKEKGNIKYDYYLSMEDQNKILLVESWVNQEEQERHLKTIHYQELQKLKSEYVVNVDIEKYYYCI